MSGSLYLAPGFLISIGVNGRLKFPHFRNRDQRVTPPRVGVINALNGGCAGTRESLVAMLAERHHVSEDDIRAFLEMLDEAGYLTDSEPAPCFTGDPAGRREPLGDAPLAIPAPVSLVTESGQYLWYDHEGNLATSLQLHEIYAVAIFTRPIAPEAAWAKFEQQHPNNPLDREAFFALAERLKGARLLRPAKVLDAAVHDEVKLFSVDRSHVQEMVDARVDAHDEAMAAAGRDLLQVVPVNTLPGAAPVSLGMVMGYAMDGLPDWHWVVKVTTVSIPPIIASAWLLAAWHGGDHADEAH